MMEQLMNSFENLKSWINKNGGYVNDKLSLVPTSDSRLSIVCNTNLDNEKLFLINKNLILSPEKSQIGIDFNGMDFKNKLSLALLFELKSENSFFNNYFQLLPPLESYKEHPIFLFSENKFPRFSEKIYVKAQEIYQKFVNLYNFCNNSNNDFLKNLNYDEILWAYLTVISRSVDDVGLVPLFDFFQHLNESNSYLVDNTDSYTLTLSGGHSIGEIVYVNNDYKDEIEIFLNKGIVDKTDICFLKMEFQFKQKSDIINTIVKNSNIKPGYISSLGVNANLLYYLRVNMMSESDLIFMSKNYNFYEEIISIDNERRSLQKLKAKLSNLNSKEELDYVNSNLTQLSKDSLEFKICKIIQKIDKMSQDLSNSIYEYWGSLL